MKNISIASAVIIVVLVLGFAAYKSSQNTSNNVMMKNQETMMRDDSSTNETESTQDGMMQKNKMRYVEYSKKALTESANTKRVLFFYANWCPTCRPADADFSKNTSKIPDNVTLIRVNYNDTDTDQEEKDLATKYQVTYQHTFIQIDEQGNVVTKWNGGQTSELLANIK